MAMKGLVMSKLKQLIKQITGEIYIPEEAHALQGKTLLHISDTPQMIFTSLRKLIEALRPDYIVHTGDMVDNIKLEIFPYKIDEYKRSLLKLNRSLSVNGDAKLIIGLGNHDDLDMVKTTFREAAVYDTSAFITIEDKCIQISHYPPILESSESQENNRIPDISLFGHDLSVRSHVDGNTLRLNGIEYISLIELKSLTTITLNYPPGTNDSRLRKRKIGI